MFKVKDALICADITVEGKIHRPLTKIYRYPVVWTNHNDNEHNRKHLRPFDMTESAIPLVVARFVKMGVNASVPTIFASRMPVVESYKQYTAVPLHSKAVFVWSLFFLGAFHRTGAALRLDSDDIVTEHGHQFNWFFLAWDTTSDFEWIHRLKAVNETINQLFYWGWLKPFYDAFRIMRARYYNDQTQYEKNIMDAEAHRLAEARRQENADAVKERTSELYTLMRYMEDLVYYQTYHVPMIDDKLQRDYLVRKNRPHENFFSHVWLRLDRDPKKMDAFTFDNLQEYADPEHVQEAWMYYDYEPKQNRK